MLKDATEYLKTNKLKVFEAFSGVGMQRMSLDRLGIDYISVGTSEIDIPAINSYAAIHDGLLENDDFEYPSKEEMTQYLEERNIGLDFKTGKLKIPKSLKQLQMAYKSAVLSKCYGDVSILNPHELPDMDLFTYSFPCFVEGTLVLTDNGYKPIEDIQENDVVLTHTNKYQRVVKPMVNEADHIYKLSTMASEDMYVTEEHPYYVRKKTRVWNNERRIYDRLFDKPEWVKVKDLDKSYYVGCAINQKSNLPVWNGIEYKGNYGHIVFKNELSKLFDNNDFWWIVGRFIGDGWTREYRGTQFDKANRHDERVVICCAKTQLKDVTSVLDKLPFNYCVAEERTVYKIHITNRELTRYLYQFGKGAANKCLTKDIIDLPCDLLKSFLDGYLSSDGYIDKKGNRKISSVSRKLIYDTAQCVMKVYKRPVSIYHTKQKPTCVIEGRVVNQKDTYELKWKLTTDKQDKAFYEDGYIWSPIHKLEKHEYNGLVYNMEVENDNSYVVQNIIVHNCTDLSVAGKQQGMEKSKTRSGLLYECEKIIEAKRPKYLMLENVKPLVGNRFKPQFDEWLKYLDQLGYNSYWEVLNAKNFDVPQNRERVFCISVLKECDKGFEFPEEVGCNRTLRDILDDNVDEKYYIDTDRAKQLIKQLYETGQITSNLVPCDSTIMNPKALTVGNCITARYDAGIQNKGSIGIAVCENVCVDDTVGFDGVRTYDGHIPTLRANRSGLKVFEQKRLGGMFDDEKGKHQAGSVWDKDGLSPTLDTMQGGYREPCVIINKEVWKEYLNTGYFVSNFGRVANKDGSIKSQRLDKDGYPRVNLYLDGKNQTARVHTLVATVFVENLYNKDTVNHIDGNRENNHYLNLEWATIQENLLHKKEVLKTTGTKPNEPKGVSFNSDRKKWESHIKVDGKTVFLGRYETKEEGYKAYFDKFIEIKGYEPWDESLHKAFTKADDVKINVVGTLKGTGQPWDSRHESICRVYGTDGLSPTISTCQGGGTEPKVMVEDGLSTGAIRGRKNDGENYEQQLELLEEEVTNTITTVQKDNVVVKPKVGTTDCLDNYRIRKLTPKECWVLMGIDPELFCRAEQVNSNSQLYKQAGNGIVVNCLDGIFRNLFID